MSSKSNDRIGYRYQNISIAYENIRSKNQKIRQPIQNISN
jgi:hypothetical protein